MVDEQLERKLGLFLVKSKILISKNKYDFVPRQKNMLTLAKYGLTIYDAKIKILGLTEEDYFKGPKKDLDNSKSGDIREFKKNLLGIRFYIKLKLVVISNDEYIRCIAFHEDEFI